MAHQKAPVVRSTRQFNVGERVELEVVGIAHGGESIARLEGWVFFLRYAIPSERVIAQITEVGKSFHRADALEIITPSKDRITPPCPYFHPGGCGGCDFQHITLERQRQLKADVIKEQFARVAKMDLSITVQEVALAPDSGSHYRTRLSLHIDSDGRAGFRKARSHQVLPIEDCRVVSENVNLKEVLERKYPGMEKLDIPDESRIEEILVHGKTFRYHVSSESFWQGHRKAAQLLGEKMIDVVKPRSSEHALDLYGGVGLFGKLLASNGVRVDIIESSASAVRDGLMNMSEFPDSSYHRGDVAEEIEKFESADIVILDPPRSGAEHSILNKIAALEPRVICYISCDPASLARDCQRLAELGYAIASTSAFDLFPQTAHIECVFTFERVIS